jgi:hypothetical protein
MILITNSNRECPFILQFAVGDTTKVGKMHAFSSSQNKLEQFQMESALRLFTSP